MDDRSVRTCPKCGALITPQLDRCRVCGTYLHGTAFEGFLVEHLLPPQLRASPGTGLIALLIGLFFVFQSLVAGPIQVFSFSPYSLRALGGLFGPDIVMGEWWRFVTSMFAHGGLLHLGFNLYALTIIGPVVEQLFDRKKMWTLYVASGVLSMVASYTWNVEVNGQLFSASVGASGAISGLIGATIAGGRREGPRGAILVRICARWALYMVIFGLLVPGIDNAAHAGGFLAGLGLGQIVPLGLTKSVAANRALSVLMLGVFAGIVFCFAAMFDGLRRGPGSLADDAYPSSFLFLTLRKGTDWDQSTQYLAIQDCESALRGEADAVEACRFAVRAHPHPVTYQMLARAYREAGNEKAVDRLRPVLRRLR
ncbi:MAG: rhomboid family intramembrane serine protease [Myxococcota bacterium]